MVREGFNEAEVPPQAAWWWSQSVSVLSLQIPITVSDHVSGRKGGGGGGGGMVCICIFQTHTIMHLEKCSQLDRCIILCMYILYVHACIRCTGMYNVHDTWVCYWCR